MRVCIVAWGDDLHNCSAHETNRKGENMCLNLGRTHVAAAIGQVSSECSCIYALSAVQQGTNSPFGYTKSCK